MAKQQRTAEQLEALEPFLDEGLIERVLHVVKSGKEATVYCCRGGSAYGGELVAAKIYRSREHRGFKNDSVYREGRVILDSRARRAVGKKTHFGRQVGEVLWLNHEYEIMTRLHRAGADVPRPLRSGERALLMEFLGDEGTAAPPLYTTELTYEEARRSRERLLWNIERFLADNWVHGDLSPYNILFWRGTPWVIDFPQAVDARTNRNAEELLYRDVENVCDYFSAYGIHSEPERITRSLWRRYRLAEL